MLICGDGGGGGGQRRVGHAEALMLAAQHVEAHLMAYAVRRQRHGRDGRVRHLALVVVMVIMLMMVRRRVYLLMLLLLLLLLNKLLLRLLCGSIFHTRGLLLLLLLLLMKMAARVVVVAAVRRAHHRLEVEVGHMLAVDCMRGRQVACRCHTRRVAWRKTLLLRLLLLLLWLIAIV